MPGFNDLGELKNMLARAQEPEQVAVKEVATEEDLDEQKKQRNEELWENGTNLEKLKHTFAFIESAALNLPPSSEAQEMMKKINKFKELIFSVDLSKLHLYDDHAQKINNLYNDIQDISLENADFLREGAQEEILQQLEKIINLITSRRADKRNNQNHRQVSIHKNKPAA